MNYHNEDSNKKYVLPNWAASLMLVLAIVIVIMAIYFQFTRYQLVGRSLQLGDTASTALLLTPEISHGIVKIFRG